MDHRSGRVVVIVIVYVGIESEEKMQVERSSEIVEATNGDHSSRGFLCMRAKQAKDCACKIHHASGSVIA